MAEKKTKKNATGQSQAKTVKKTSEKKSTVVKSETPKGKAIVTRPPAPVPQTQPAVPPAEKREQMPEDRKIELRRFLVQKRTQILREAKSEISKYIKGETRQLVDTALDDGDWSVVDLSEDISLRQLGTHRKNLQKIDEALRKLDEGTYGICEDCGEEISQERLKIVPFAIYCTEDQERREKMEELG